MQINYIAVLKLPNEMPLIKMGANFLLKKKLSLLNVQWSIFVINCLSHHITGSISRNLEK